MPASSLSSVKLLFRSSMVPVPMSGKSVFGSAPIVSVVPESTPMVAFVPSVSLPV